RICVALIIALWVSITTKVTATWREFMGYPIINLNTTKRTRGLDIILDSFYLGVAHTFSDSNSIYKKQKRILQLRFRGGIGPPMFPEKKGFQKHSLMKLLTKVQIPFLNFV